MRLACLVPFLLLALALPCACSSPQPSPEYAEARELWSTLVRERLDQAAADPRVERVLELLSSVPANSRDAAFAAQLKKEIEQARREHLEDLAKKEAAVAKAREAIQAAQQAAAASLAAPVEPPAAEEESRADAGLPLQPTEGMDAALLKGELGRCFERKNDALVAGMPGGEIWGLKDVPACRDRHPDFLQQGLLVFDGKVSVRPAKELAPRRFRLENGKLVLDEGARAPAAPPPAAPPPEERPPARFFIPDGRPLPSAQPSAQQGVPER
jgi:hypothetical protein